MGGIVSNGLSFCVPFYLIAQNRNFVIEFTLYLGRSVRSVLSGLPPFLVDPVRLGSALILKLRDLYFAKEIGEAFL